MGAFLSKARFRLLNLFRPSFGPRPVNTRPTIQEEPDLYHKGGFQPVSLGDTFQSGRYMILRKLGYGQYSTVWLAKDSKYVKIPRPV